MDAMALVRNGKSQKQEHRMDEGRNLIRNLPDVILQHILSFLPMKDVVKTSILSKRWKNLWMSVPNLEFEGSWLDGREHFIDFVDRVMILRDLSDIRKFSLSCDNCYDASRINTWIFGALCQKVQELVLILHEYLGGEKYEPLALPHCLYTCRSLTVLELHVFHDLKLPSTICLPNLKELKFSFVNFADDHSTKLFDGCPNLQKLTLEECTWNDVKFVCISSPKLKFLSICDVTWYESHPSDCQFVICGTNLKFFSYSGYLKTDMCLYSSSLVNGCMDLRSETVSEWGGRQREAAYRAHKLLMGFSSVESLTVSPVTLEVLGYAEELYPHLPVFHKLNHLKLVYGTMSFNNGALWTLLHDLPHLGCLDFGKQSLQRLLHNLPHLDCLDFGMAICMSDKYERNNFALDPVPPCLLTRLKTIKIERFGGTEKELYLIKVLLDVSTVLEKMYIWDGLPEQKEIAMFSRGSKNCEIIYL